MVESIFSTVKDFLVSRPEAINSMWIFIAGSTVALLRSMIDGARRNLGKLLLAAIFGGLGAMMADQVFRDSSWHIFFVGAAAVITENLVMGLWNASSKFKDDPITIFTELWKVVVPSLHHFGSNNKKDTPDDSQESSAPPLDGDPGIYGDDDSQSK